MTGFFVYMLRCSDNSYYLGHTDNIEKRIAEHEQGTYPCCYTKSRLPVKVVFIQRFATRHEAFVAERQIKKWRRAKKEAVPLRQGFGGSFETPYGLLPTFAQGFGGHGRTSG